jgi:hypothetical protein
MGCTLVGIFSFSYGAESSSPARHKFTRVRIQQV